MWTLTRILFQLLFLFLLLTALFFSVTIAVKVNLYYSVTITVTVNWRNTGSSQCGNFAVVRTRTTMADGAFTVAGPAAWNAPPPQLRNVTSTTMLLSHLKTHLYNNHLNNILEVFKFLLYLLHWPCPLVFIVFLNFILLLCFVPVVYCGALVLRMRGALANDTIWYDMIWMIWLSCMLNLK